jgi:hypothetical protein
MLKRVLRLLIPAALLAAGAWVVYRHYSAEADRREASLPAPSDVPGLSPEKADALQRLQRKRLQETLRTMEETRRQNPPTTADRLPPQGPTSDVQRTFKTLDEINRLNRLNREMREKQRAAPPSLPAQ